jgi:uncharacterized membrane protein
MVDNTTTRRDVRVLLIGESWVSGGVHTKGANTFEQPYYEEGGAELVAALESSGYHVDRLPSHLAGEGLRAPEQLEHYALVILSDVGADSFLLTAACRAGVPGPNHLADLAEWVRSGGALLMVGGYMSFAGFDGRAHYGRSPIGSILPVVIAEADDRAERPEGVQPSVCADHPVVGGLPRTWPPILGYNQVEEKDGGHVLVKVGPDPLLTVGTEGRGRVAAFTTDCAPHWASHEFLEWEGYSKLFTNLADWLTEDFDRSGSNPHS